MLYSIISKQFSAFPQSVQEVFYGCLIGFSFSYVMIEPLSFPTVSVIFIVLILWSVRERTR